MGDLITREAKKLDKLTWSEEQIKMLNRSIGKNQNMSLDDWKQFAYQCQETQLNPWLGQVFPVKFNKGKPDESLVFMTSIAGYRNIAERTKQYAGSDEYLFDDNLTMYQLLERYKGVHYDGKEHKLIIKPHTASCTVWKIIQGIRCPTKKTVQWSSRYPKSEKNRFYWNKDPCGQLGKCSEALALRAAFPFCYDRLYIQEELQSNLDEQLTIEVSEQTITMINEIEKRYDILGYNEASKLVKNSAICGDSNLMNSKEEDLIKLMHNLDIEIEKLNKEK